VAVGVAEVGTGLGNGGTGIVEVGDGVADIDVGDEPDGDGSATDELGLGVADGLAEICAPVVEPGVGVTSARAGKASARQTAAVSAATAPRRTTV
jgi:hypothetical protein